MITNTALYQQTINYHGVALKVTYRCEVGAPEEGFPRGTLTPRIVDDVEFLHLEALERHDAELLQYFNPSEAECMDDE